MKKLFIIFYLCIFTTIFASDNLEEVKLKLNWKYQFQFAGFIAAKEKGFYKDVGLDVTFIEKEKEVEDFIKGLVDKKYDYVLSGSRLFFHDNLKDVKLLANYFKESPLAVATQKDIINFNSLRGKYVMFTEYTMTVGSVSLLFDKYNMKPSDVVVAPLKYSMEDFIDGKLDATVVYTTDQLYYLDKIGMSYNLFSPSNFGFNTPEMNLLTTNETYANHNDRTLRFLEATNKGWEYALDNKREIINIIYDKYSKRKTLPSLKYEANRIEELFLRNIFAIGEINLDYYQGYFNYLFEKKHWKFDFDKLIHKPKEIQLTNTEKKWINDEGKLRLVVYDKNEPFIFFDKKTNTYEGLIVEYAKEISKILNMPLVYEKKDSVNPMEVNFMSLNPTIISKKSRDILGQMNRNSKKTSDNYYLERYFDNIKVEKNFKKNLSDLKKEKIDYFITNELSSKYWQRKIKMKDFHIDRSNIQNIPYPILFNNTKNIYGENLIENTISFMNDDKKREMYLQWTLSNQSKFDYDLLWRILAIIFVIFTIILYFNYKLKVKVNERTREIEELLGTLEKKVIERTKSLEELKNEKELLLDKTMDSIKYASLIQNSIVPKEKVLKDIFPDSMVIWEPRDIVGGDIYFIEEFNNKNDVLIFVIDCIGHGVHGALITTLVKAVQKQITDKYIQKKLEIIPSQILNEFDSLILNQVGQNRSKYSDIGFDGGVLHYKKDESLISYAGARTPLFYIQKGKLKTFKSTNVSIDSKVKKREIEDFYIKIYEETYFYISTDGFIDQIGGKKDYPFGKKAFCNMIEKSHKDDFHRQKGHYLKTLKDYSTGKERNDDVCLLGFKVDKS